MNKKTDTLDQLLPGNFHLRQAKRGHRYSVDAILLARFVGLDKCGQIADLGTGNGVLPLLLAHLSAAKKICGFELQPEMVQRARYNIDINGMGKRISIIEGDVRRMSGLYPGATMDLVVSNPPYRSASSGRIAPDDERARARHELAGGIEDFAGAAHWLLKPGGRFTVIYLAERLNSLLAGLSQAGIEPKRLRMVHATAESAARLVLVEGTKGGRPGLQVEKPLVLYVGCQAERRYSAEVEQMYRHAGAEG